MHLFGRQPSSRVFARQGLFRISVSLVPALPILHLAPSARQAQFPASGCCVPPTRTPFHACRPGRRQRRRQVCWHRHLLARYVPGVSCGIATDLADVSVTAFRVCNRTISARKHVRSKKCNHSMRRRTKESDSRVHSPTKKLQPFCRNERVLIAANDSCRQWVSVPSGATPSPPSSGIWEPRPALTRVQPGDDACVKSNGPACRIPFRNK